MRTSLIAAVLLLIVLVPAASADSVTWTLHNFTFSDGATVSGSFVYDATTNTFSSIHIVTSSCTLFSGAVYTAVDPGFGPFSFDVAFVTSPSLASYTGTPALELGFATSLTDLGGIVLTDINEFTCTDSNCSTAADVRGTLDGGYVSTPEPSSLTFLALSFFAAGLLGFLNGRSRSRTLV